MKTGVVFTLTIFRNPILLGFFSTYVPVIAYQLHNQDLFKQAPVHVN
jgi:hypothetical protein